MTFLNLFSHTKKFLLPATLFTLFVAPGGALRADDIRHVLVLSIDGMHALDLALYIKANPNSALAQLAASGINYTNASATKPSDSIPATAGIFTGGSPNVTGVYYDDAWNRALYPAADVTCKPPAGTQINLKETIDVDPTQLNTTLDPAKLPRDASKGCTPVFPHSMLRVNTVFEVIKAAGLHTAYSEKRPSYDFLNGPSGTGVDDLYTPEIATVNLLNTPAIEAFDDLRVASIINEIDGKDHTGTLRAPVPAIFGMNFQAINSAKKGAPHNGYLDIFSNPDPAGMLQNALDHTDQSIGKMVAELKAKGLYSSTAIIVVAKHGESPLDNTHRFIALIPTLLAITDGLTVKVTEKTNAFIWMKNPADTPRLVAALDANSAALGIGQILSGESLKLLFPDPTTDATSPDIVVVTNTGVNFETSLTSTTLAEHGGFGENETHVPLLVSIPGLAPRTIKAPVTTTQIAPTTLQLLQLSPSRLQAVQLEGTRVLPGLPNSQNSQGQNQQ